MRGLQCALWAGILTTQAGCGVFVLAEAFDEDDPRITAFEVLEPALEVYEGAIPFHATGEAIRANIGHVEVRVDGQEVARGEIGEAFTWQPEGEPRLYIVEITWGIADPGSGTTYQATDMREIDWRPSFGVDIEVCADGGPCEVFQEGDALTLRNAADVRAVPRDGKDEVTSASFTLGGVAVPPVGTDAAELDLLSLADGAYTLEVSARRADGAETTTSIQLTHAACALPDFEPPSPDAAGAVGLAFDAKGGAYIAGVRGGKAVIDRVSGPPTDAHEADWISSSEGRFGPLGAAGGILHTLYTPPSGDVQIWRATASDDPAPTLVIADPTVFDIISLPDGTAVFATVDPDSPIVAQLWHLRADNSVVEVTSPRRPPKLPLYFIRAAMDEVLYAEKGWFRSIDMTGGPTETTHGDPLEQPAGMASYGDGWFVATEAGTLKILEDERFFARPYRSMDWLESDATGGGRAELSRSTRAPDCPLAYAATRNGFMELGPRP